MPTIINGIGTWYYGKRRIHRVKAACSSCNSFCELESYDTTLYFVFVMIPVVPLGQKRILEQCGHCQRHRVMPLKTWEAAKSEGFASVLEKLRADPDNKETIQEALALATSYQDERAFDRLAEVLAGRLGDDPDVQFQLGWAYEYFSRWPDAEEAYRRVMAVMPSTEASERLAVCLLKQQRPEEAIPYLEHVFEEQNPDKAWLTFWLIEGLMANGRHESALDFMDRRDAAFPKLATEKTYKRQRRTAEKYRNTDKPIPSAYIGESCRVGYSEGSGLGFKWPKYVAAALLLGVIALYLGSALYKGQSRRVYLLNGWTKPYAVSVNGQVHQLQPGARKQLDLAEGEVTVDWPDSGDGPQSATIRTNFFGRPFNDPVFVINPDRCALLEREEVYYGDQNRAPKPDPPVYRTGELLHQFDEVDYEFEPFPMQLQMKAGSSVRKTRVDVVAAASTWDRLLNVSRVVPHGESVAYCKRLIHLDPSDGLALGWLTAQLPAAEAIAFLKTRLGDRPIRVEWHRQYQSLVEQFEPNTDLKPEYRRLVEETKRDANALYLLGRVEDDPVDEKLFLEATGAQPPSAFACNALSFGALVRGDFATALKWSKRAVELDPTGLVSRQGRLQALLAAGEYRDYIAETGKDAMAMQQGMLRDRLAALLAIGDKEGADNELRRAMPATTGAVDARTAHLLGQYRATIELQMALAKREWAKYPELADRSLAKSSFTVNLLRGDHVAAAKSVQDPDTPAALAVEIETARHALLYLAGLKAKQPEFAAAQWQQFAKALTRGTRSSQQLAQKLNKKEPLDIAWLQRASIRPSLKRVVLLAVARKFPDRARELEPLAKKLDFERDEVSLCLHYLAK